MRIHSMIGNAKQLFKLQTLISSRSQLEVVPKGHIAVYVGELQKKRSVVPYLSHPSFAALLNRAEEEFEYNHPIGGLTIPCREDTFIDITSRLSNSFLCEDMINQEMATRSPPRDSTDPNLFEFFVERITNSVLI